MNSKDVIRRLTQESWDNVSIKGDQFKFKHPGRICHVVVPHPLKDIAIGTLRNIYRQAGLEWK
ncbi:MAG: type II toxin-antitoxin system HicA family toxin [Candidatus Methylumidiphilus sp.]